ncbi:hypothetical protein ACFE04_020493 [Oxalis oulophora]
MSGVGVGGGGSLGIRSSASYGSLDKQHLLQNGALSLPTTNTNTNNNNSNNALQRIKPQKIVKDKDRLLQWFLKFTGRRNAGMFLICLISAAVFFWVLLYMGKGGDTQDNENVNFNLNTTINNKGFLAMPQEQSSGFTYDRSLQTFDNTIIPPPPPSYFLGYTLPQSHHCNSFTLPPPPADRKRTGPRPCPVCYLPVDEAIALMPKVPSYSPLLKNLTYVYEKDLNRDTEFGGSEFGGYPTLKQRNDSYDIRELMSVHCGFVKGDKPGRDTGFDMDEIDLYDMDQCRGIVVASAIFSAFDDVHQPRNISDYSRHTVCFIMFVDEQTEAYLKANSYLDSTRKIGIWRIVVVHNLPYTDGRRTGKIPKLLSHRMFPDARFSIWIDGKLELVADPHQILERFLWRQNATFAISRHYRRFDVFTEAEANKAAGKYDNASIDFQIEFYKTEGLTSYTRAKLPITSDVPEGCVILREHVPISNLFTCLWFNEIDRFTSRDQLSFSTVRDKIKAKTNFNVNMFLDCERRNFVIQKYHRGVNRRAVVYPPPRPPALVSESMNKDVSVERVASPSVRKSSPPRRRRRHRKAVGGDKETQSN